MPIRGKSDTANNPNSALKSRRTAKAKTEAESSKATEPQSHTHSVPTGVLPDAQTVTVQPAKSQIGFPGLSRTAAPLATQSPTATPVPTAQVSTANRAGSQIATHRRDLTNVDHGLELPQFNPNQYMAKDLFTNSSPLPETSQIDADAAVLSIARKRQTLRVVQENIALNRDTVKTATQYQGLLGDTIDYSTQLVDNQTRYIKYLDAGVKQQTAATKLSQSQELHAQENIALAGMQAMTPLIQTEWEKRLGLRKAKINALEEQTLRMNTQLEQKRRELEGLLNVTEFQTI